MSVDTAINDNGVFTIAIEGDFLFSSLNEFTKAYEKKEAESAKEIVIDMKKALTVDSSALGMLLNMQQHLNKADRDIKIINCNKFITNIFNITSFSKKFTIE